MGQLLETASERQKLLLAECQERLNNVQRLGFGPAPSDRIDVKALARSIIC
jgi:hypothetical protein